jgi:hypothetical protein
MNDQDEVSADREDVSLVGRHSRTPSSDGAVVLDGGDGCHQEPVPANFFDKRGISSEVMQAQGYIRYEKGDAGPLQQAWPHHRRFAAEIANQCGGWVIPRYAPQGLGLGPVSAQVRPDDDVEIDRHPHYHGTDPSRSTPTSITKPATRCRYEPSPQIELHREWRHDHRMYCGTTTGCTTPTSRPIYATSTSSVGMTTWTKSVSTRTAGRRRRRTRAGVLPNASRCIRP